VKKSLKSLASRIFRSVPKSMIKIDFPNSIRRGTIPSDIPGFTIEARSNCK
jgi:hypothetical protein